MSYRGLEWQNSCSMCYQDWLIRPFRCRNVWQGSEQNFELVLDLVGLEDFFDNPCLSTKPGLIILKHESILKKGPKYAINGLAALETPHSVEIAIIRSSHVLSQKFREINRISTKVDIVADFTKYFCKWK